MSYQRFGTPKIYVDNVNWLLSSGHMSITDIYESGSLNYASGSSLYELFDMKPSNVQTITANGLSAQERVNINTQLTLDSSQDSNFCAILGHNFEASGVEFKLQTDDGDFSSSPTDVTETEVVNCSTDGADSGFIKPIYNGWSLFTFSSTSDNQLIRLIFQPSNGTYTSDIKIGAILIGEVYEFPVSPDLNIKKSFSFEGVTRQESVGGQTYANAQFLKAPSWLLEPFHNGLIYTPERTDKSGRVNLDMSFSYLDDTNVYAEDLFGRRNVPLNNSIATNLINKTHGGMLPMLFQYDGSTATAEDSFLWCRLNNEPEFTQVANQVWSTSIKLREEF